MNHHFVIIRDQKIPEVGNLISNRQQTYNFVNLVHRIDTLPNGQLLIFSTRYAETTGRPNCVVLGEYTTKYLRGKRARPFIWSTGPNQWSYWSVVKEMRVTARAVTRWEYDDTPVDNTSLRSHLLMLGYDTYKPEIIIDTMEESK